MRWCASCGATTTSACSASATSGPTAASSTWPAARCCWPATASAATPAMVRELLPEMRDAVFAGHAGNDGSAIAWGRAARRAAGRPGRLPGPRLLGGAAGRADHLGADDGRRHPGQCRRPALPRRDRTAIPKPRCRCWRSPAASPGTCSTTRLLALGRSFPDFVAAEAAGAVRHAADAAGAGRADRLRRGRAGRPRWPARGCAAPYHAIKVTGALFHTQGGLDIDAHCRVLRADGTPLPNLLAAGGAARGVSGNAVWGYLSGNGLLSAVAGGCDRRAHRGADRSYWHDRMTLKQRLAEAARAARPGRLRRAVGADRRAGRLRGAVPVAARRSPTPGWAAPTSA